MAFHASLAESETKQLSWNAPVLNSNFRLIDDNASYVAQIGSRLNGIPLAMNWLPREPSCFPRTDRDTAG